MQEQNNQTNSGSINKGILFSLVVLFLVSLGVGAWLQSKPVDIILKSKGVPIFDAGRQIIKSPVEGTIRKVYVKSGENVLKGDVIYSVAATENVWKLKQYQTELVTLQYKLKRLKAEQQGKKLRLPANSNQNIQSVVRAERSAYKNNIRSKNETTTILKQQISNNKNILSSVKLRYESVLKRYAIAEKRKIKVNKLFADGVANKVEVQEVENDLIEMQNERNKLVSEIKFYTAKVANLRKNILVQSRKRKATLSTLISNTQSRIQVVKSGMNAIRETGRVILVRSPLSGKISLKRNLRVYKAVYRKSEMFTIETSEPLVKVKAYVNQNNIKYLLKGQRAKIKSSYGVDYYGIVEYVDYKKKRQEGNDILYPLYILVNATEDLVLEDDVLPVEIMIGNGRNPNTIFGTLLD